MSPALLFFVLLLGIAQLSLPRRLAFLPLLIAVCHVSNVEIFANLTASRLLILIGVVRAVIGGHFAWSFRNRLDCLFLLFAILALLSTPAHRSDYFNPFTERAGLVLNVFGSYIYARCYLQGEGILVRFGGCLALVLLPLALALMAEQMTGRNPYSIFGARIGESLMREGRIRASGPFSHPILAGTAGATCMPLMIALWKRRRGLAILGGFACVAITIASASSGPLATLFVGSLSIWIWRFRNRLRAIQIAILITLVGLHLTMTRPVWFLMAKMDLAGGSTGRHRALLIDSAISHFGNWWLAGTDYTRDWTPFGVSWSPDHADITNYYLRLGVIGGLPLMLTFIVIIFSAFQMLGLRMAELRNDSVEAEFALWCLGAALFSHTINMLSVSYFDQMYVLLFFLIGLVPGLVANQTKSELEDPMGETVESDPQQAHAAVTAQAHSLTSCPT